MTGGKGSRLWPISKDSLPKQFVKFQDGKPSLFKQAVQRLAGIEEIQSPIVLCNGSSRFLVVEQLHPTGVESADIILKPIARNTARAAADHLIENIDAFHKAIAIAAEKTTNGKFATFGVVPAKPETGYG